MTSERLLITSKPFTVIVGGNHATAYRHDKTLPRVKRAANARHWKRVNNDS